MADPSLPQAPPAASQLQAIAQTTSDMIVTINTDGVIHFVNNAVADVLGYTPDELIGEPITELMPESAAARHRTRFQQYLDTGEQTMDWENIQLTGQHKDGSRVPLSVSFSEFSTDEGTFFTGIMRANEDQQRRERYLSGLHEFAQSVSAAETAVGACHIAMATLTDLLPNLMATVYLYDETTGRLTPTSHTPAVLNIGPENGRLFTDHVELLWTVYHEQERRSYLDTAEHADLDAATPLQSLIALPLGPHGVLVSGTTTPDAFDRDDVHVLELLASDIVTALDRVTREELLRTRAETLEERTASLERVSRTNEVIRDLTMSLVQADSRADIEGAVCTKLANVAPNQFVWIGEPTATGTELHPNASAGVERGFLDISPATDAQSAHTCPASRAVATREVQVQNNLLANPPFETWREEAIRRGYKAAIAIPLLYRDRLYGVLTIYAGETDVFDDREVDVLRELGSVIGYAINAVERKAALVSDETVELQFEITNPTLLSAEFTARFGGEFTFNSLVERPDGRIRVFFQLADADPDDVCAFAAEKPQLHEITHISEMDGTHLYEATLGSDNFLVELLDYGARPTGLETSPAGTAHLTVELPNGGDTQSFLRTVFEQHDGVSLMARRELDRPVKSEAEVQSLFEERLTDRETEVLRTAYQAGFFESPRRVTGGEVADMLDVSQPTVNRHLRRGESKLLGMVFGDEPAAE